MDYATRIGIIVVLTGLFEIFVTPVLIRRFWNRYQKSLPPHQFERVVRMTRTSGLVVIIVGLFLIFGFHKGAGG